MIKTQRSIVTFQLLGDRHRSPSLEIRWSTLSPPRFSLNFKVSAKNNFTVSVAERNLVLKGTVTAVTAKWQIQIDCTALLLGIMLSTSESISH